MPEKTPTLTQTKPFIYETLTSKSLYFSIQDVQSKMHILRPDELQFEYTRLMMGFLLLITRPRKLLMIGLGGGSLAKFCYRHLSDVHITVVEINPHVIALRKDFAVPDDDEKFTIIQTDAAKYVQTTDAQFDVVLADGFDVTGLPEALSTGQFYEDCRNVLSPAGVFVANLHRCSKLFDVYSDRMEAAFDLPPFLVNDPSATNCIAFAGKHPLWLDGPKVVLRRPEQISQEAWIDILPSVSRVYLAAREMGRNSRATQWQSN